VLVPKDDAGYKQLPQQIADLSAAGIRYVMFLPPPRNDRAALSRLAETVLPTSRAG
jgi:hypothetical protein